MSSEPHEINVPPPSPLKLGGWASSDSSAARSEEREWSSLDTVRLSNDTKWLKFYGWLVIGIAVVFSLIFLSSLIIWALHYMMPVSYLWLSTDQLSKIQSVLFSGGMGAVISSLIKRQMDRLESK